MRNSLILIVALLVAIGVSAKKVNEGIEDLDFTE